MPKKTISAKVGDIVDREARKEAKRRGITFSRLVEISLIHELQGKTGDNGLITELMSLREIIDEKINDLEVVSYDGNNENIILKDAEYYVNKLVDLHNRNGKLTLYVINRYSDDAGLTFDEMLEELKRCIPELMIEK